MRKFIIPALALSAMSAVAVSTPASAQYRGGYDPRPGYAQHNGQDIVAQIRQIGDRIDRSFQRGAITRNEARRLSNELGRIDQRFRDYRRGGLSTREHHELQNRIQNLRSQLREDRQDGRRYDDRYDRRR
ncbi:MAG TPA: hypothetical protein VEZ70_06395 [Allosphingosinicella sp.]|nr:hypothetical protein [Allosphingosinicella sp.]